MKLCSIHDVSEGSSLGIDVEGETTMFVVKKDDNLYIYKNSCPHLGVQLEWQENQFLDMDGVLIQCSTHGALFEIEDGKCISGPCQGDSLTPVPFEIRGDDVYLI